MYKDEEVTGIMRDLPEHVRMEVERHLVSRVPVTSASLNGADVDLVRARIEEALCASEDNQVVTWMLNRLVESGNDDDWLGSDEPQLFAAAARIFGEKGDSRVVKPLMEIALNYRHADVYRGRRDRSRDAHRRDKMRRYGPIPDDGFDSVTVRHYPEVRKAAADALGKIAVRDMQSFLRAFEYDLTPDLRKELLVMFKQWGSPAIDVLCDVMFDRGSAVSSLAWELITEAAQATDVDPFITMIVPSNQRTATQSDLKARIAEIFERYEVDHDERERHASSLDDEYETSIKYYSEPPQPTISVFPFEFPRQSTSKAPRRLSR